MNEEIRRSLVYFTPEAARLNPPATEEMIASAEERIGLRFPPSLRAFLKVHNGVALPDDLTVLGVPPVGETTALDIVESTPGRRTRPKSQEWIVLTADGTGDTWVLLPALADERGEYPVAEIDHETGEIMAYGASSYDRFLWFLLDRTQRFFEPDGKEKQAYHQYVGMAPDDWDEDEFPEWMDEEPYLPWPFDDLDWILQHDPALTRLRPAGDE